MFFFSYNCHYFFFFTLNFFLSVWNMITSDFVWFWRMVYKTRSTFYKTSAIRYKRLNCVCLVIAGTTKSVFWTIVVPEYASIYTPHIAGTVIDPYCVVKGHLPPTTTPEYHDDLCKGWMIWPLLTINLFLFSLFHFFLSNTLYWLTFIYIYFFSLYIS